MITSISWNGRRFAGACGSTETAIQLAVRTIDSDWTIIQPSEPGAEDSLWYTAAWSPNGEKLAFVNDLAHAPGVYVIDVDGCLNDPTNCSSHVQGPYGSVLAEYLSWSPDEKNLAVIVDSGIEICNINTKQCRVIVGVKLKEIYGMVHGAAWSPDGKWIGYIIDKEGGLSGQNLNVISPKGGALTFLTDKDVAQVAGWLYITP